MSADEAILADRAGRIALAAEKYEEAIAAGDSSLATLLRLALLYWQATDPGLAASQQLLPEFMATASQRSAELLDDCLRRVPSSAEFLFWRRYIAWTDQGVDLDGDYCRHLLRRDPATLVPALFLFAASDGAEAKSEAMELLEQCRKEGGTGSRYVVSVIEGVLKRMR